jgi:threonine/homoserine/homoserine lactone efflux protein
MRRILVFIAIAVLLWVGVRAARPTPKSVVKAREKRRAQRRDERERLAKQAVKELRKRL